VKRLAPALLATLLLGLAAGLVAGPQGFSPTAFWQDLQGEQAGLILGQIRAPRSLGALAVGALLGLAGAVAQGLFRNPLADPYLLGTAAGAGLAVVLVMATASAGGFTLSLATLAWIERVGLVGAAFVGALGGMALTLSLAAGAVNTLRLLLAGVVVAVVLGAASDLVTTFSPDALRGKQAFMLGSTSFLGWDAVLLLTGRCAAAAGRGRPAGAPARRPHARRGQRRQPRPGPAAPAPASGAAAGCGHRAGGVAGRAGGLRRPGGAAPGQAPGAGPAWPAAVAQRRHGRGLAAVGRRAEPQR
jgi:hypothetical protein